MKILRIILIAIVAFGLAGGAIAEEKQQEKAAEVKQLQKAPEFNLTDADGKSVSMKELLRKDYLLVAFVNASCGLCYQEMKWANTELKDNEKLDFIAVFIDARGPDASKKFREEMAFSFDSYFDPEFSVPKLFGFAYTPASVLLNKNGEIVAKANGWAGKEKGKITEAIANK